MTREDKIKIIELYFISCDIFPPFVGMEQPAILVDERFDKKSTYGFDVEKFVEKHKYLLRKEKLK